MMKQHPHSVRVALNVILLAAIIWTAWWIMLIAAFPLVFRYRAYEILLWGIIADAIYSASVPLFVNVPVFFSLLFLIVFLAAEYSKRFLVFYE